MNVDQIIDKRTVAIPGPASTVPGPQGLPGVNAVPADNAVAAYLSSPASSTRTTMERLRYGYGCDAVFIGDSITEGYGTSTPAKRWSTILCSWFQWTEHNYAIGGTGWLNGADGTRFPDQCAKAAADTTYDHANVRYCFMLGGVNDGAGDAATATSRAKACITTLKAAFPQATIITGLGLQGPLKPDGTQGTIPVVSRINYYRTLAQTLTNQGVICIPDCWRWLYTRPDLCTDDALHPNDNGYAALAGIIAQIVYGTYSTPTLLDKQPTYQLTWAPNITDNQIGMTIGYESATLYGSVTATIPPNDPSIGTMHCHIKLFTLPNWIRIAWSGVIPPFTALQVNDVSSGFFAYLLLDQPGEVSIMLDARWFGSSGDALHDAIQITGYQFKQGDTIRVWFNWTVPIIGYNS